MEKSGLFLISREAVHLVYCASASAPQIWTGGVLQLVPVYFDLSDEDDHLSLSLVYMSVQNLLQRRGN